MPGFLTAALMGLFVWHPGASIALAEPQMAPLVPTYPTYQVALTGYNAVPGQTDSDPYTTASGAYSNPDVIAARSVDLADQLPFGTVIEIDAASSSPSCGYNVVGDAIGLRVIGDSMNPRIHNTVDVLLHTYSGARALGVCDVTIKVLGRIDIARVPTTQKDLRLAVGYLEEANAQPLALEQ